MTSLKKIAPAALLLGQLGCQSAKIPQPEVALQARWDTMRRPLVIGHRGTGNVEAPENTFASLDYAAGLGTALEFDVMASREGVPILLHDPDFKRVTGGAVTQKPSELSLEEIRAIDVSGVYRPDLFLPQRVPTFEEVLVRYGRQSRLIPEVKWTLDSGRRMAELVTRYGLEESVLIQVPTADLAATLRSEYPKLHYVWVTPNQVPVADVVRLRLWGVFNNQKNIDAAYVAAMHEAGAQVFAYTVNRITDAERMLAYGVDGLASDDPALLLQAGSYTPAGAHVVDVPKSLVGSGWRPYASAGAAWRPAVVSDLVTWQGYTSVSDTSYTQLYLPSIRLSDAVSTTQRLETTLAVVAGPASGNPACQLGLRFAWSEDNDTGQLGTPTTRGYYVGLRLDGVVELSRVEGQVRTEVGRATWSPLAVGQSVPLQVDLTADTLTVTRTDTGENLSVTDATHPRSGFVSVYGMGVVPGIGTTTVSYEE